LIAAQNGTWPDADVFTQNDVPNYRGPFGHPGRRGDLRFDPIQRKNSH
jgi:hypothetical protein